MSSKVLVFDFGASSARAMLVSYENSKFKLTEVHRFENIPIHKDSGIYWDIDYLFSEIKSSLSIAAFMGGFDAVSIDTWGVDFGLINTDGTLIENPHHYRDERTFGIPEKLKKHINDYELFVKTGVQPMRINTIYQLLSLKYNDINDLFKAERILLMPDLFAYMLTGEIRSEYTMASTTQLIDPNMHNWNYDFIEQLELPSRLFPKMIFPGEKYGTVKQELVSELNIPQVPVIAVAGHDTASAVVSVPCEYNDFLFISCGTWTLFGTEISKPILTRKAYLSGFTNEGGINKTTTFLKNIMGLWLIQESRRYYALNNKKYSYSELESFASKCDSFKCFINPNDDLFSTPDDMPLKIQQYCKDTNQFIPKTIGEIMRCIYDSLSMEFLRSYENISEITGKNYRFIHMIGGGTKDALLCQSTANALGIPVFAGPTEATAIGNAICSLISLGEMKDIKDARKSLAQSDMIKKYVPQNTEIWALKYNDYLEVNGF